MIEPEMAFCRSERRHGPGRGLRQGHDRATCWSTAAEDLELFAKFVDKGLLASLDAIVDRAFVRLPYTEAVDILKSCGRDVRVPGGLRGSTCRPSTSASCAEEHFKKPVIVYDYPREIKAFYMRLNDDGKTVAAMDLLVPGIGEIIGGSQREERLGRAASAACASTG